MIYFQVMENMKCIAAFLLFIAFVHAGEVDLIVKGNVDFSKSLYQEILKHKSGNVVLSPLSAQIILGLIQLGARGKTALELAETLHLPKSPNILKEGFKDLISHLKGNNLYDLHTANKIYLDHKLEIKSCFKKDSEKYFDAYLDLINFADNQKAAETINQWIQSRTNDKIKNMVPPELLGEQTSILLVNTLHFRARWSSPFIPNETKKRKFFKSEYDDIKVDTMHQVEVFNYFENTELDAKLIQLPYQGSDITFTIILPNRIDGLRAVENKLDEFFLPQNYTFEKISLYMPKFKINSDFNLIPPLQRLGIQRIFSGGDLSGMIATDKTMPITDVLQKAILDVDEEGTEAAAATVVNLGRIGRVPSTKPALEVHVDRPFFYAISCGKLPLFVGRVTDPTE
ncbi:hypothetical protein WA026_005571 [Henosepilachna vigintioctopunctata]|uniref:Serpin domain-containing protein n=1 Tax=Henosepilachna vigintioctopunctata TaxID=420089 RepID=A0AAW1TWV1_9CUCU